ncbi:MAG: NFACT family protein [Blastocatellia bacterium]|nr:NFACT family protein [Blastocatellia bacterium]
MEVFTLHALLTELAPLLTGHRLGKIVQLGLTDLAFDFHLRDGRWLFVSTDPKRLALHLTTRSVRQSEIEARTDTAFVSLAKKHLSGARVSAIEGLGYDRVARLSFVVEEEVAQPVSRDLVIQLTGRSANVLVLENNRILASLRERQADNAADESYQDPSPPAEKIDPFYCSAEKLNELIATSENDPAIAARVHLIGFGPQFAAEFAARTHHEAPPIALQTLLDEIFAQPPSPAVYSSAPLEELKKSLGSESFSIAFAPIRLAHCQYLHCTPFASVNQAADACFTLEEERRNFLAKRQQIESQLNTRLKKLQALHKNLAREQSSFANAETHQRYGELLLANLHQAEKLDQTFRVVDFYDPEQRSLAIPAANQSTAQEAAEHYFKLARKARNGLQTIAARLPQVEAQITELQANLKRVHAVQQSAELTATLREFGMTTPQSEKKARPGAAPKKQEKISGVRYYRSSDGYEVLVGRTSRDNDQLTMRVAKSFDLWFHAADYPGSHVILRNPKRSPLPQRAIVEAAQLAAKFSQANNDSGAKVAVNYCEKKFVTKPKGFAPGQVRLSSYKTILVEPGEAGERLL